MIFIPSCLQWMVCKNPKGLVNSRHRLPKHLWKYTWFFSNFPSRKTKGIELHQTKTLNWCFFFFGLGTQMISVAETTRGISMKPLEPASLKLGVSGKKMIRGMKVLQSAAMIKGAVIKNRMFFGEYNRFWVMVSQIFLMFISKLGEDSRFDSYFSKWLKPPTSFFFNTTGYICIWLH